MSKLISNTIESLLLNEYARIVFLYCFAKPKISAR